MVLQPGCRGQAVACRSSVPTVGVHSIDKGVQLSEVVGPLGGVVDRHGTSAQWCCAGFTEQAGHRVAGVSAQDRAEPALGDVGRRDSDAGTTEAERFAVKEAHPSVPAAPHIGGAGRHRRQAGEVGVTENDPAPLRQRVNGAEQAGEGLGVGQVRDVVGHDVVDDGQHPDRCSQRAESTDVGVEVGSRPPEAATTSNALPAEGSRPFPN